MVHNSLLREKDWPRVGPLEILATASALRRRLMGEPGILSIIVSNCSLDTVQRYILSHSSLWLTHFNSSAFVQYQGQTISSKCYTTFEIRILSQATSILSDRVKNFDYVFVPKYTVFGETEFISYHKLQTGYIKPDESIDIRVHLKINSFKRCTSADKWASILNFWPVFSNSVLSHSLCSLTSLTVSDLSFYMCTFQRRSSVATTVLVSEFRLTSCFFIFFFGLHFVLISTNKFKVWSLMFEL